MGTHRVKRRDERSTPRAAASAAERTFPNEHTRTMLDAAGQGRLSPVEINYLQHTAGNQAVQRLLAAARARVAVPTAGRADDHGAQPILYTRNLAVQRMSVAVGDLKELEHAGKTLSPKERKSAAVITKGISARVRSTGEKQANPWDERYRPFKSGPLANIGNEELRIYGHGEKYKGATAVAQVGGYTPEALATKLIEMGLPEQYSAEIYLTGCETAKGENLGFLGKFYQLITAHCPGVKVRGNVAISTTFADGTQGVWTGVFPSLTDFKRQEKAMGDEADKITSDFKAAVLRAKSEKDTTKREELIADLMKQKDDVEARSEALLAQKERLKRVAYSTDPGYTRVLPA